MKMKQPELGRKIADLRKAKGYTQEELVEKCNLSVRTLQRIESGEVEPRSHTIRVIFSALDYQVYDSSNIRLRLFFKQVSNVFNLKTNTMKKLSILAMACAAAIFVLLSICVDGNAQSENQVRELITNNNANSIRWFNSGNVDSLLTKYSEGACVLGEGCGTSAIRDFYRSQMGEFQFESLDITSLHASKSMAVEKGRWMIRLESGLRVGGEYLCEWHQRDKKTWLIVNEVSVPD
ncbi:MAG: helix-turn-helix transcriptional regulator [Bacteroidales bacterium]|nr:helix-turn-helix transcriptional regulator [Bacteroidales bacterium]